MNQNLKLLCAAKINLCLDITGKRPDNYHTLKSIFQSVSVYDRLEITLRDGNGVSLTCDAPGVPCDESNLACKAAELFLEYAGIKADVHIHLEKKIPSGAGMGGGSADAAGVLYALNQLLNCHYENAELRELGVKLGADVPFMLMGGTALAEGIGEVLKKLPSLPELPLVILKGEQSVSTPAAYRAIDALVNPVHPDTETLLKAVTSRNIDVLYHHCANLFESVIDFPEVQNAENKLLENGAECAVMTGSGAAVFGIFKEAQKAQACAEKLKSEFAFVQACHTTEQPFLIIQEG